MLKLLQFLTIPVFLLSLLFYLLVGFAWKDGRSLALEYVLRLQQRESNKNKTKDDK